LGKISIIEYEGKITHLYFSREKIPSIFLFKETPLLKEAFHQLHQYFSGTLKTFSLPLAPMGTPFMQDVWKELLAIPY
jgi:methylated-DNA-[protein]-cysteine S-methyltransferase